MACSRWQYGQRACPGVGKTPKVAPQPSQRIDTARSGTLGIEEVVIAVSRRLAQAGVAPETATASASALSTRRAFPSWALSRQVSRRASSSNGENEACPLEAR